ncbi:hypothetical protein [Chlorogloea sp. CCALA 695]|uniref:hypothetical protein n=1 Tax=Chlorogloea sp. CCALA 695 TaxID=2107693 RepID=UPI001E3089A6|nr:hypothetical protein [Chlorogloea sp. CCALA 695]
MSIPTVKLFDSSEEGLIFGVVRGAASTQQETTQPEEQMPVMPEAVEPGSEVQHRRDNWRTALNFKNLFDIKYYNS